LKQDINNTTPFVSDLLDLAILKAEYSENKFEVCFDALYTRFKQVRRLRRDGNCFYRALLFQLFEHFITTKGPDYD
jgi:ubiquitin thioesterase protein OTUB1